jgi:DNA-binding IclR family transcriptional regulator
MGDLEVVEKILRLVETTQRPVSIDFVARNLKLNWSTARVLLMQLSLEGCLKATKTTKSWVFMLKKDAEP